MSQNSEPRAARLLLEPSRQGASQAYDERTFRHFLTIEQKRAERSGRVVLLLLVHLDDADVPGEIQPPLAAMLFNALIGCVREVDFVGWYCTGSVVGAVLMQGSGAPPPASDNGPVPRVGAALRCRLPAAVAHRIQLRLLHVRLTGEK